MLGGAVIIAILATTALSLWLQYDHELSDGQRSLDGLSRALAVQTERAIRSADSTLTNFLRSKHEAAQNSFNISPSATAFGADNPTIVSLAYVSVTPSNNQDVAAEAAARRAFAEDGGDPVIVPRPDGLISVVRRDFATDEQVLGAVVAVIDPAWLADFARAMNFSGESVATLRDDYGVIVARNGTDDGGDRLWSSARVGEYALSANISLPRYVLLASWHRALFLFGACTAIACIIFGILVVLFAYQWSRRERAEEIAHQSEARFRNFAEAASDWLWETDANHRFTYISERFTESTGADVTNYLGRSRLETAAMQAIDPNTIKSHMDDLETRRSFRDFVYPINAPSGIRHLRVSGQPHFESGGLFTGYRGTASDVTEIVKAQERVQEAKEAAEFASRAKSEFLANMSHELRTPLNAVIGFSEIIRDQLFGKIEPRYAEYARDINMSGKHLLDLINDVLDMSKVEAGHYELRPEEVNLGAIAHICDTLLATRVKESRVRIEYAPALADTVLFADTRAIKQILLNVIANAVKFTPPQGLVKVTVEKCSEGISLIIADTGIGIEESLLSQIGNPFFQADASISRIYGGSGLGLAICSKLIALHEGRIEITSHLGNGTTVRLFFPQRCVRAMSSGTPAQHPFAA
jgi:PAS domain S-box-containing protein